MSPKGRHDDHLNFGDHRRQSLASVSAVTLATRQSLGSANPNFSEGGPRHKGVMNLIPKMKLRIEREDGGNLLIGGLSLANNCQAILVVFGFFFIFAGVVLTIISYKTPINAKVTESSTTRDQGKVSGPLFLVVGSLLFVVGSILSLIHWKLHQEAKIQRNRFSVESIPVPSRMSSTSAAPEEAQANLFTLFNRGSKTSRSRASSPNASSSFPSSRRESLFSANYYMGRRRTLPTVSQAVPVRFLIDGKVTGYPVNPGSTDADNSDGVAGTERRRSDTSRRKASLSLRATLPIPLLPSPNFRVRSLSPAEGSYRKSDEPFGSIASLSGTGDIACFPAQSPYFPSRTVSRPFFQSSLSEDNTLNGNDSVETSLLPSLNPHKLELPVITVNDNVDPFNITKHKRHESHCLKSPMLNLHSGKIQNDTSKNEESLTPEVCPGHPNASLFIASGDNVV